MFTSSSPAELAALGLVAVGAVLTFIWIFGFWVWLTLVFALILWAVFR